jgi:hypothetical protein
MLSLLSQLLKKRNIDKIEDLSQEERTVFDNYQSVLKGETLSVDTIKEFCTQQIKIIETKFASEGTTHNDDYLKACLHVYLNLLKTIEAPEAERKSLEKYLTQLINNN